jgi:hypothetical protein
MSGFLLHFLLGFKENGAIFSAVVGFTSMVHAVRGFTVYGPRPQLRPQFGAPPLWLYGGDL